MILKLKAMSTMVTFHSRCRRNTLFILSKRNKPPKETKDVRVPMGVTLGLLLLFLGLFICRYIEMDNVYVLREDFWISIGLGWVLSGVYLLGGTVLDNSSKMGVLYTGLLSVLIILSGVFAWYIFAAGVLLFLMVLFKAAKIALDHG